MTGTTRRRLRLAAVSVTVASAPFLTASGVPAKTSSPAIATPAADGKAQIAKGYGRLPLSFERNVGQADRRVEFVARGRGYTISLARGDVVLALLRANGRARNGREKAVSSALLGVRLVGATARPRSVAQGELPGRDNDFVGKDPSKWRTGIPTYARVDYRQVYPGVDLVYYGNQGRLEHDFVVAPGADPNRIALRFQGADRLRLNARGELVLHVAGGDVRLGRPVVYQQVNGERRAVIGGYRLRGAHRIGFRVGAYDRSKPLVIDPVLLYSTYLGGGLADAGRAIAVDASGNAYVTGETLSTNFPTSPGSFHTTSNGGAVFGDAFVTKLNPTGSAMVYSTYLGGSGEDQGLGIAVDSSPTPDAFVGGRTSSADFPTTPGAFRTTVGGGPDDAFVTRLNSAGSLLVYSTYLGGSGQDIGEGLALDASDDAYLTGFSNSSNFPTTSGAWRPSATGTDAFVTKLNPAGSSLVYSTFLGGAGGGNFGFAVAVDSLNHAYVTGLATSGFPTTAGAFQPTFGGVSDAFVTKLNQNGSALDYSSYLGGSDSDFGIGIAVDGAFNAYVTGQTQSTEFPTTTGAFDTTLGGSLDGFVTKVDPTGSALVYSTYLGGSSNDAGLGIVVDVSSNAYIVGATLSSDFPTENPIQPTSGGGWDAFVTKMDLTGKPAFSTYLGGPDTDEGFGIALDSSRNIYVTGFAGSGFPTTPSAFQTIYGGGTADAFVAKIGEAVGPPTKLALLPKAAVNTVGATHCLTATVTDAAGNPVPGVTVVFSVPTFVATHASPASGSATTNSAGQATFCYSASLPGADVIHAFADTNNSGQQDPGEPFDDATKTWVVPVSTAFCEVTTTNGGWFIANNGDRATFGGNAKVSADGITVQGQEEYQDHGPAQPRNVKSIQLLATTCSADLKSATIYGTATIDGSGTFVFRIDVIDNGEPGTNDEYGIILSDGYASGEHKLMGGNVVIHNS